MPLKVAKVVKHWFTVTGGGSAAFQMGLLQPHIEIESKELRTLQSQIPSPKATGC